MIDIFQGISIFADISIIFLLAVQSWVLVKLLPEIKRTAANSNYFTDTLSGVTKKIGFESYPKELHLAGFHNCKNYKDKNHVHTVDCK